LTHLSFIAKSFKEAQNMILLVASNKDTASLNIAWQIRNNYSFDETTRRFQENPVYEANINDKKVKLVTLNNESIYAQDLPAFFNDVELAIFISRHSSESMTPTLSVHTPGNLGQAKFGGISRKVSFSPANAMRNALKIMMSLNEEAGLDYEVSYEATHHGPSLDVPTMFAELGSSSKQWNDLKAAEIVAHAAIGAISKFGDRQAKAVLGVGGTHYSAKFTHLAMENEIAFGHIIPKYAISNIDVEVLRQCIDRTLERVDHVVLDWKGIKGENKPSLARMLAETGLPSEKV
jgi:D-aminoacyl-tRNA deacylase